jgi:hypothetical protein
MSEWLTSSALWSVLGFFAGYGVGSMGKRLNLNPRVIERLFGLILVVLTVLSFTAVYRFTSCQTQQNEGFRQALQARAHAQRVETDAQRQLLMDTLHGQFRAETIHRYLAALASLDRARDEHPLVNQGC